MHALAQARVAADRVVERIAGIGADPRDGADLQARKALLVLISVLILPIAALWGVLYLALGSPVGGGAWSLTPGGPSNSVRMGFRPSAQTW